MAERTPSPRIEPQAASKGTRRGKDAVEIKLEMLDGSEVTVNDVDRKVKAQDVIERAHTESDCGEKDFFSLFFYDENRKIFPDPLKSVRGQLPKDKQGLPWRLSYGVKFYIPDPANLKEDYTRYLYCLQLCRDIRANRVLTDRETATRLSALMLQASLGDYDPETHKEGYTGEFEDFLLLPKNMRPDNYEAQLVELHKAKAGYNPARAESEFLQVAKELPRYGMHLFAAQDEHHTLVLIGTSYRGISIYRDQTEVFLFPWPHIVKISYKRKKFRIKYRPTDSMNDTSPVAEMNLSCGEPPSAKWVWKNAVEQHTFFRLTQPDPPSRIQTLLRRGSKFRYSGRTLRQTQKAKLDRPDHNFTRSHSERLHRKPTKDFAPGYVRARDSAKLDNDDTTLTYVVGKQNPSRDQTWVLLERPPTNENVDTAKFEQQKVQVDFRVADGLPEDTHQYVIKRDHTGSFELLTSPSPDNQERTYRLSIVDQDSTAAMTAVSLNIDPSESTGGQQPGADATPMFDSKRMPVVKLNAAAVTTATVIESEGKRYSSGVVSQKYPPEESDAQAVSTEVGQLDLLEAGPAEDGSEQAEQVRLFLAGEHDIMQKVFAGQEKEEEKRGTQVEIEESDTQAVSTEVGQLNLLEAGPAEDGSEQAEQVRLFLAGEHNIMQKVFAGQEEEEEEERGTQVEIEVTVQ